MNVIQCVPALFPDVCPNSGLCGVSARTSASFTCVSFHLKISTPSVASTRKHSENPARKSSRQLSLSFPYFAALFPICLWVQMFGQAHGVGSFGGHVGYFALIVI